MGGRARAVTRALALSADAIARGRIAPDEALKLARTLSIPAWLYRWFGDWGLRQEAKRHGHAIEPTPRPFVVLLRVKTPASCRWLTGNSVAAQRFAGSTREEQPPSDRVAAKAVKSPLARAECYSAIMNTMNTLLAVALAAQASTGTPNADSYVGRWNLKITDAADTFESGGFQIEQKSGALDASLVWRWGSYLPAKSIAVKDGALLIVREEQPGRLDEFTARLDGETLKGQVKYADGTLQHFEGRKAPALAAKAAPAWGAPVTLFDGKTLGGWKLRDAKKKNGWAVQNGELAVVETKDNADLVTERAFQDMKLHLEFNVDAKSNSGVYLRGRYEIQILDNPDAKMALDPHGCGALYSRVAPKLDATRPAGEWQTLDITIVGRKLEVVLNGKQVVDTLAEGVTGGALNPFEGEPGPLMLQGDHGKVRFRNIVVTPAK
jgi:hypothetical protein